MDKQLEKLKEIIEQKVFITNKEAVIMPASGGVAKWLFDFRRVLLNGDALDSIADLFLDKLSDFPPYQIGGLEVAAIPLVAATVLKGKARQQSLNGFFVRKSRKKTDLMQQIEGVLTDEPVVLVDDLLNHGYSFMRQIELLESLGKKVIAVCTILRFRELSYYQYFHDRNIKIISIFTLDDFANSLKVAMLVNKEERPTPLPFRVLWQTQIAKANYFYVVPKSAPVIDEKKVYFGSDNGNFWALDQVGGKEAWHFKIFGFGSQGKTIFSSPTLYKNLIYFGAYDGNFYALDKETGKKKWMFMEADWIGSSPCVAKELDLVFVGLEFGFWKKHGGIVALNTETGKKQWLYYFTGLTHGSPAYYQPKKIVVIGSNDGGVYAFKAQDGELLWQFQTGAEVKASFVFDEKHEYVCFGSHDGKFYILNIDNGLPVHVFDTEIAIYSTPLIYKNKVFFASLNKIFYCLDLDTFEVLWQLQTNGRIFASPIIIEGRLYVGSNDARLYEVDPDTGKKTGIFQATERIVNKITYNPITKRFFVPTFANELYCLIRDENNNSTP